MKHEQVWRIACPFCKQGAVSFWPAPRPEGDFPDADHQSAWCAEACALCGVSSERIAQELQRDQGFVKASRDVSHPVHLREALNVELGKLETEDPPCQEAITLWNKKLAKALVLERAWKAAWRAQGAPAAGVPEGAMENYSGYVVDPAKDLQMRGRSGEGQRGINFEDQPTENLEEPVTDGCKEPVTDAFDAKVTDAFDAKVTDAFEESVTDAFEESVTDPGDLLTGHAAQLLIHCRGAQILVDKAEFIIGCSEDADLTIPMSSVSSRHCRIECRGDNYYIEDTGSTSGVLWRGENEDKCFITEKKIEDNDIFRLGNAELRCELTSQDKK